MENVVTNMAVLYNNIKNISTHYLQDLKIANITCNHTPSNSLVFAYDAQVIGGRFRATKLS